MATFKVTTLFTQTTAVSSPNYPLHRSAGWSESVYMNATSLAAVLNECQRTSPSTIPGSATFQTLGLWPSRAALLPLGAAIVGARLQQVDVPGPVQTVSLSFPGSQTASQDPPQNSLLMRAVGVGVNNVRRFTLRSIPAANIIEGEFQPGPAFQTLLGLYVFELGQFAFRARTIATARLKIISISAAGLATFEAVPTFVVNSMIKVTKTRDATGNLRSGRFQVSAIGGTGGPTTAQLVSWPTAFGVTTGGSAAADAQIIYPNIDPTQTGPGRIVIRKVGRPFVGFRGRRSRRR